LLLIGKGSQARFTDAGSTFYPYSISIEGAVVSQRAANNNLPKVGFVPGEMDRRRSFTPFFDCFRLSGFICWLHEATRRIARLV